MKRLALSIALAGALVGVSFAGSIDNSAVYNKVGVKNSTLEQRGAENSQNLGTYNSGEIYRSNIGNETYVEGSSITQRGYRNHQNLGVQNQ